MSPTEPCGGLCPRTSTPATALLLALLLAGCGDRPTITPVPDSLPPAAVSSSELRQRFDKREVMIPMRDGVRLFTAIYTPKASAAPAPIFLHRTPYSCAPYGDDKFPNTLGPSRLFSTQNYIFVYQDVRGRYMSEGEFENMRPFVQNKQTPRDIDENSDTYDTIEWLLANVAGHNGRVGLYGISYPGFYSSMGAIDSHPALVAVSPQAPIADWFFDDFRHHGAFFLAHSFPFMASFDQPRPRPTTARNPRFNFKTRDGYAFYLNLGGLRNSMSPAYLGSNLRFWPSLIDHPNYDEFWRARDILPHLRNIRAAVMVVGGWFDAEDLYGTFHTYQAIEAQNPGAYNILVVGPWAHGGWSRGDGARLGNIEFGSNTSDFYRERIEYEFFTSLLQHGRKPDLPEAYVFETGENRWRKFDAWPPRSRVAERLYIDDGGVIVRRPPGAGEDYDEFISDPTRPVPHTEEITTGMTQAYMVDDQRYADRRTDVLSFATPPFRDEYTLAGPMTAHLWVSTSATDSDWIVKIIDEYPLDADTAGDADDMPALPPPRAGAPTSAPAAPSPRDRGPVAGRARRPMGGYQMLVRSEVFRGRFRNGYDRPQPFTPDEPTLIRIPLQDVLHTFREGHRLRVQIHSTWFPLVERNPQRFLPHTADAQPDDYTPARHRVYHSPQHPTHLEVGVLN
jgi:putative CocE/NonD family hydrolase